MSKEYILVPEKRFNMRREIIINDDVKLVMTKDEFGYLEVLDTLDDANFVRIVTYNISKESNDLIKKLETFPKGKDVIIVTNIPSRFKGYTSSYAKARAQNAIDKYIERLNPEIYSANVKTFFNFGNHSKIIMTDKMAYIGSANFSDESKNNNECGVLITNISVISKINEIFIQMQIDESVSYYSSKYMKAFVMISDMLTQAEVYYEDYYWSFFADSGHQHHGRGDEYRSFDAELSPITVENVDKLTYLIEDSIEELNNDEIYPDIFENINLDICKEIRDLFGIDSELEQFSRFNSDDKIQELFKEYLEDGDPEFLDEYAQTAVDNTGAINMDLADAIYETALIGKDKLEKLCEFLVDLLKKVEEKREVNEVIDNT